MSDVRVGETVILVGPPPGGWPFSNLDGFIGAPFEVSKVEQVEQYKLYVLLHRNGLSFLASEDMISRPQ